MKGFEAYLEKLLERIHDEAIDHLTDFFDKPLLQIAKGQSQEWNPVMFGMN